MLDETKELPEGFTDWLNSGTTGASAESIAAHLVGHGRQQGDYPHDAGDFGRCERLLTMVPILRAELPRMAEVNAYWAALVGAWDEIAISKDQYAKIKAIVEPIQAKDPDHIPLGENVSTRLGGTNDFRTESEDEQLFRKAAVLVWSEGKASTSLIQRKLGIGYNKAARLMEKMESMAIVSKPDHVGKRTIHSPDDLRAALNIREEVMDIAGEEKGRIILDSLVLGLKAADAQRRRLDDTKDQPRMKETAADREVKDGVYRVAASELRSFVESLERLAAEKKDIAEQEKEVKAEAKARGYDVKAINQLVALRKRDKDDVAEEEAILEMYKSALGM